MDILLQLFLFANVFFIGVILTLALQQWRSHQHTKSQPPHHEVALPPEVKAQLMQTAQSEFKAAMDESAINLKQDLATTNGELNKLLEKLVTYVVNEEMEHYRSNLDALHKQNETTLKDSLMETTDKHIEFKTKLIQRQAELDKALIEYQTKLEGELAEHQADADKKLADRQAELVQKLEANHAKLAEYQSLLEAELTKAQTKQTELYTQLEANLTKEMETKKQFLAAQIDTKLADAIGSFLTETLGKNVDLGAQSAYLTAMLDEHKDELKNEVSS
ncbi:hypothetical protein KA093_00080 [Candidatus Saccharibacteria bacterium]|nr:hypothetical protein [Candidatus Saccharibacteria bacterium]